MLWGYDPNFIIPKHIKGLFLQTYVCAKFFAHPVSQSFFAHLCVDAIIELGTKDGTSAESVEFVCVDDESEDVVVTGGVVVDEDVDDEGVHSTNVDRDDIDDVDDDDVDEG